jgi:MscS family membrane protein
MRSEFIKLAVLVSAVLLMTNAFAIEPEINVASEPVAVEKSTRSVSTDIASPRATMRTFIHAMNDIRRGDKGKIEAALKTLDLSDINPLVRVERGTNLAWTLLEIIDRTRLIKFEDIPEQSKSDFWLFASYSAGAIQITRQADGSWLFDRESIKQLPALLEELEQKTRVVGAERNLSHLPWHLRIRSTLPDWLKQKSFLLENWHWLGLLLIVAAGVVVDWVISFALQLVVRRWRKSRKHSAFLSVSDNLLRPVGMLGMALVWLSGINLLGLPEKALLILLIAVKFLSSLAAVWTAYRLVDLVSAWLLDKSIRTENKIDDVLAPLIPRTLKIFITVIGIVFIADNLNIDITGLLAGLGLGGLAFALAAKDMVQNLFGSMTVLLDKTFTVGDWIVIGDREGTVERIGFRSTKIRTFYNSLLTIPNADFITQSVDNMGDRRYRRLSTKFGIAYETPADKIEAFCEGVRELVRQHPYMRKDYYHVYLNSFADSALEILIYVFWEVPEWNTELRERHRFLLDCLRLAKELGIEFAYPTHTLYMKQDEQERIHQEQAQEQAFGDGRKAAKSIVESTTGLGVKPPPVSFD